MGRNDYPAATMGSAKRNKFYYRYSHQNEYLVPRSRRKGLHAIIKNSVAY